jgi:hypothetical protein
MPKRYSEMTDRELVSEAHIVGGVPAGATLEAMRRLRQSFDRFNQSSDKYSRRMLWLNVILTILTAIQVVAAWPIIKGMLK